MIEPDDYEERALKELNKQPTNLCTIAQAISQQNPSIVIISLAVLIWNLIA
jgi:hypothetical protein